MSNRIRLLLVHTLLSLGLFLVGCAAFGIGDSTAPEPAAGQATDQPTSAHGPADTPGPNHDADAHGEAHDDGAHGTGHGAGGEGESKGRDHANASPRQIAHRAEVPAQYAALTNPSVGDAAAIARGGRLFSESCALCHGDGGMGDGPLAASLETPPTDLAHTGLRVTDGYLYWRITEGGHGEPLTSRMPAWRAWFDTQARWDLIAFIQALGRGDVAPTPYHGGAVFDPAAERAARVEAVAIAVRRRVITQAEGDLFIVAHDAMNTLIVDHGFRLQGNGIHALLPALVEDGTLTQAEADLFETVHSTLKEAGLVH